VDYDEYTELVARVCHYWFENNESAYR